MMASGAVKLIVGGGDTLLGRVLFVDAWGAVVREMPLQPRRDAPASRPARDGRGDSVRPSRWRRWRVAGVRHSPVLLDVRSQPEVELASIPGSVRIPWDELAHRMGELPDGPVVVHCKTEPRAILAARILAAAGRDVRVMSGGILGWIDQVDPTLTRY